jgi:XTP/dITP diphosphohydrolase
MKFLLATTNEGKIREYRHLLGKAGVEFATLAETGIREKPEETGTTCEENAILKAKFYFEKSNGMPTLADDGGLEIDALGGEPGVRSRRWPGYEASDEELVQYAIERMKGIPLEKRTARLTAVLAVMPNAGEARTFQGTLEGRIVEEPCYPIIPGYPFRSLFYEFQTGKILAELPLEELPNGHREQAIAKALPYLLSL